MIRPATNNDLPEIIKAYRQARQYMIDSGNPHQWADGHPAQSLIENDIATGLSYVCERDNKVVGVFAFIFGIDPTYLTIDGQWINDEPYGTIHRIASNGTMRGVFTECIDYCKTKIDNLRIDTHEDNNTMKHLLVKNDFQYCGVIKLLDGRPRIAFQWSKYKQI